MRQKTIKNPVYASIDSLSHDGRGIAHINNKITFIENALPGEEVNFIYTKQHNKFNTGIATEILKSSCDRIEPSCKYSDICGGCSLQHLNHEKQIALKAQTIKEHLKHIGGIEIENLSTPITAPTLGYRSKARLSVKYVHKKEKLLVGFHEKNGSYVSEMDECTILHPSVGKKINLLQELISSLSIFKYIAQIEVACGTDLNTLVFRNLQKFSDDDIKLLNEFSKKHNLQIYSQSGGIDTVAPLTDNHQPLSYKLPNHKLEIFFNPTDFTQINHRINEQIVDLVLELLEPKADEQILDLFCGIGNFTLPIASKCKNVTGVEGSKNAIIRAEENTKYNNLKNTEFHVADLTKELSSSKWSEQKYDKIILDPPRTGAQEICDQIKKFGSKKIIYVSCNPATFARDAKIITKKGYKLDSIRLADMYPHTKHIETIASFIINT